MWGTIGIAVLLVYFAYSILLFWEERDDYWPYMAEVIKERPVYQTFRCLIIFAFFFLFGPIIETINRRF